MRSWAGTGVAPATPRSEYSPPGPGLVGVEEQVRHRLRRVRPGRARRGVVGQEEHAERLVAQCVDQRTDDVGVPAFERCDLLVDGTLVARLVGGLDVEEEEVTVRERRQRRVTLRDVVVVEAGGGAGHVEHLDAGEDAEAAHEVDGRRQPAARRRSGR